jgi:hypothetical protein
VNRRCFSSPTNMHPEDTPLHIWRTTYKNCSKPGKVRTFAFCFIAINTYSLLSPAYLYRCIFLIRLALTAQPQFTAICMYMQVPMHVHTFISSIADSTFSGQPSSSTEPFRYQSELRGYRGLSRTTGVCSNFVRTIQPRHVQYLLTWVR